MNNIKNMINIIHTDQCTLDLKYKEGTMPNYYNSNRGNEHYWIKSQQGDFSYASTEPSRDRVQKSSKDLIIDDNSVYEIDQDCYEKVRQSRMNQRQDWNKK
ncbi:MAG: hypothetical protein K0S61_4038 [Anaerocolumna sp.]|jgi:hypothetical protein|nr:hypothetical protein [Anaerocolumna sp.]